MSKRFRVRCPHCGGLLFECDQFNIEERVEISEEELEEKVEKAQETIKKEKPEECFLRNVSLNYETEKAYQFKNGEGLVAWLPKKAIKNHDDIKEEGLFDVEILSWFFDKGYEVNWKEEKQR